MKAIAKELELVPSTALHILRVLVAEELVKVDASSKRYGLGSGMLSLARSVIASNDFASLSQLGPRPGGQKWVSPAWVWSWTDTHHMVVVALSRSQTPFRLHVDVGSRFPILLSATGRLVAAFGGDSWTKLEQKVQGDTLGKPVSIARWKKEAENARRTGQRDRDTYINGATLLAVPLHGTDGKVTHTLVAAGLSNHLTATRVRQLAADLHAEANKLSQIVVPQIH